MERESDGKSLLSFIIRKIHAWTGNGRDASVLSIRNEVDLFQPLIKIMLYEIEVV